MSYPRAPLHEDLVAMIMIKLGLVYGKRFTNSYEADMASVRAHWAQELAGMSERSVRYALDHLPSEYVPNVLQFRLIANQRPQDDFKALPPPNPTPSVKQRGMEALRELREQFLHKGTHVDLRWAERIVANPQGKSTYAVRMATEVLRAHGKLPQ